jgi:hypothetical protein
VKAGMPRGTGTPNSLRTALAWYSWMFISDLAFWRDRPLAPGKADVPFQMRLSEQPPDLGSLV